MKEKVKVFLLDLLKQKNIEERSHHSIVGSELKSIASMQVNADIEGVMLTLKKKLEDDCMVFNHPDLESIETFAFYNYYAEFNGMVNNFVFMADYNGGNIWMFLQTANFIDLIISNSFVYRVSSASPNFNTEKLKSIYNHIAASDINLSKKKVGFLLYSTRPFHFFYDHLKTYLELDY